MPVYLYGVGYGSLSAPADVEGVESTTGYRVVADGQLGALVADLATSRPAATTRNLVAHERVADSVARHEAFVLARFGVVAESDETLVIELLRAKKAALTRALERLSGRVELRLTLKHEGDVLLRAALAGSPGLMRLRRRVQGRPGAATYYDRIALGELARNEVVRLQHRDIEELHVRLAPIVVQDKILAGPDGTMARIAFLVDRDDLGRFDDQLEAYAAEREGRVDLQLLGPLAPWDFTELVDEPNGAATVTGRGRQRLEARRTR